MPGHDAELVRRWFALYNARDMDGFAAVCHPTFEKHSVFASMEGGVVFRGPDGFPREYFEAIDGAFESFVLEPVELIEGEAGIVAATDVHWCGRGSGAEGSTRLYIAFWSHDGKLTRDRTYAERADAVAAVATPV